MNGLYSGVMAMESAERRLEAITTNLANVGTTAYKRRGMATTSFEQLVAGRMQRRQQSVSTIDFSQGVLRETENRYDLALTGPGFFAVETPRGEGYTRNGRFHLDEEGALLTLEGFPVAWEGGRGAIDAGGELPIVDPDGQVWQGEEQVGRLRIANFAAPERLRPGPYGYYFAPRGLREVAHESTVLQGRLESSNSSALDEMVAMISVQRAFESSTRLLTAIDQSYRRLNR